MYEVVFQEKIRTTRGLVMPGELVVDGARTCTPQYASCTVFSFGYLELSTSKQHEHVNKE